MVFKRSYSFVSFLEIVIAQDHFGRDGGGSSEDFPKLKNEAQVK